MLKKLVLGTLLAGSLGMATPFGHVYYQTLEMNGYWEAPEPCFVYISTKPHPKVPALAHWEIA